MLDNLASVRSHVLASQRSALTHPDMLELLRDETSFDAVVVSPVFNEAGYFLASRFGAPLVLFMPAVANSFLTLPMGYFDNPSFVTSSSYERAQTETPSFPERLVLFVVHLFYRPIKRAFAVAGQEQLIADLGLLREGESVDLLELEAGAQFGLYFSHPLFDAVRPTLPNTADVGGIQCREARPLPSDLQSWMAADGRPVVYVSFGSWLSTDNFPASAQDALLEAAERAADRYRFLIKRNDDGDGRWEAERLPENVLVRDWLPQQDILGHEATKLFVTQGGMLSTQEALYHGVPILVVPIVSDQAANAQRAIRQGYGRTIAVEDMTPDAFLSNVVSILGDPSYSSSAAAVGALMRDDLVSPSDRAAFWVEYVMRHGGAKHLQSPAKFTSLVAFFNVDILATLLLICLLALWIFWKVSLWWLRYLARKLKGSRSEEGRRGEAEKRSEGSNHSRPNTQGIG